jgi:hypothetical protein
MKKILFTTLFGLLFAVSTVSAASNPFFWKLTGGTTLEPIKSSWTVSIPVLSVGAITMTGDLNLGGNDITNVSDLTVTATTTFNGVSYLFPSADGSANQALLTSFSLQQVLLLPMPLHSVSWCGI